MSQNGQMVTDIGFPEFTAQLINSTFDALVSANLRQMTAYSELVKTLSHDMSQYINNTRDSISGADILGLLERVLPVNSDEYTTKVRKGEELSQSDAAVLNEELRLPSEAGKESLTVNPGPVTDSVFNAIIEAAADRIAASKYQLLQDMVKQGLLRLVVEDGTIETRLNFSAWSYDNASSRATSYDREKNSSKRVGSRGIFQSILSGPSIGAGSTTTIKVRTSEEKSSSADGSRYSIFGGVRLNFKTDYLPLAE